MREAAVDDISSLQASKLTGFLWAAENRTKSLEYFTHKSEVIEGSPKETAQNCKYILRQDWGSPNFFPKTFQNVQIYENSCGDNSKTIYRHYSAIFSFIPTIFNTSILPFWARFCQNWSSQHCECEENARKYTRNARAGAQKHYEHLCQVSSNPVPS